MSAQKKPIPFNPCGKYFGFGHDIECCNGVLMDIDEYTEGYQRDTIYQPCQCNPNRCMRCGGIGRLKPKNGDWAVVIECRTCGGTGWKKSIGYQPPDNRYDDTANNPLTVTA